MNIETKFDFGDTVYRIGQGQERIEWDCPVCNGIGRVVLNKRGDSTSYICPECHGNRRQSDYKPLAWMVTIVGVVGCIRVELYQVQRDHKDERRYMLYESGVGSGSLYAEEDLFSSREEALAECARRNTEPA